MSEPSITEGWGWPMASRKAHYFTSGGRSLCMKWLYTGRLTRNQGTGQHRGPDDCAECHKKSLKRVPQPSPSGDSGGRT